MRLHLLDFTFLFLSGLQIAQCFNLNGRKIRTSSPSSRRSIINGHDAAKRRNFFVQIEVDFSEEGKEEYMTCGGAVIRPLWVLTASHCLSLPNISSVLVQIGDFTDLNSTIDYIEGEMFVHEEYNNTEYEYGGTVMNDVALLKLSEKVPRTTHVLPLCGKDFNSTGLELKLVGLGNIHPIAPITGEAKKEEPTDLRLQEVELGETTTCPKLWKGHTPVSEMEVCALGGDKQGCYGDSGGPLFPVDEEDDATCLYGVVSYGSENCLGGVTIFMKVPYFEDWIEQTIHQNS